MGKPVFPKELLGEQIEQSNKKWLDEYKKETSLTKGYYQKIENFFKFLDYQNMPFNKFSVADIEKYIGIMVDSDYSEDTINALPGALSGFKSFLIGKYPNIFNNDFLLDLPSRYFDGDNPSDAFVLSLNQINSIREFNRLDIINEYIFEVFFQLGIKKKEISICHPNNRHKEVSCFKSIDGKEIKYNAKISQLLDKLPESIEIKLSDVKVNYYLSKVTEYLKLKTPPIYLKERKLNYSDLIKSHHRYIITCPCCEQLTENIAPSWVLAKTEFESDFRLACAECKGKYYGN